MLVGRCRNYHQNKQWNHPIQNGSSCVNNKAIFIYKLSCYTRTRRHLVAQQLNIEHNHKHSFRLVFLCYGSIHTVRWQKWCPRWQRSFNLGLGTLISRQKFVLKCKTKNWIVFLRKKRTILIYLLHVFSALTAQWIPLQLSSDLFNNNLKLTEAIVDKLKWFDLITRHTHTHSYRRRLTKTSRPVRCRPIEF